MKVSNTEPTPLHERGFTLVVEGEDGRTYTFLKVKDFGMEGRAEKVAVQLKDGSTKIVDGFRRLELRKEDGDDE